MDKRRKKTKKADSKTASREPLSRLEGQKHSAGGGDAAAKGKVRLWFEANRSDLRFLVVFGLCLGFYYLLTLTPPVKQGFFPAYLRLNAHISGAMLRSFGEDTTVQDQSLISAKGPSIEIERGCDAIEPSALFVSAVLASPVSLVSRLSAAVVGTIVLMLLNFVRIISLFLVRVYYPQAFETMHLDVWQALFIFIAILLWAIWASRVTRKRAVQPDAST